MASCSPKDAGPPSRRVAEDAPIVFLDSTLAFPRIQYGDGKISLNDRCIVRQVRLNLRMPPIYVNGRPIGFC